MGRGDKKESEREIDRYKRERERQTDRQTDRETQRDFGGGDYERLQYLSHITFKYTTRRQQLQQKQYHSVTASDN